MTREQNEKQTPTRVYRVVVLQHESKDGFLLLFLRSAVCLHAFVSDGKGTGGIGRVGCGGGRRENGFEGGALGGGGVYRTAINIEGRRGGGGGPRFPQLLLQLPFVATSRGTAAGLIFDGGFLRAVRFHFHYPSRYTRRGSRPRATVRPVNPSGRLIIFTVPHLCARKHLLLLL